MRSAVWNWILTTSRAPADLARPRPALPGPALPARIALRFACPRPAPPEKGSAGRFFRAESPSPQNEPSRFPRVECLQKLQCGLPWCRWLVLWTVTTDVPECPHTPIHPSFFHSPLRIRSFRHKPLSPTLEKRTQALDTWKPASPTASKLRHFCTDGRRDPSSRLARRARMGMPAETGLA